MAGRAQGMSVVRRDRLYMQWADVSAQMFSTCAKRQYFAVIVSAQGRVLGTGYNGSPPGFAHCVDGACPRVQANSPSGSNYDNCISVHAEANAIMHSDPSLRSGACLYVNGSPCYQCAKLIAGSGITRVVYRSDPAYAEEHRAIDMLTACNVATSAYI